MKHTMVKNGIVSYELEPEDADDRHVIEIFKARGKVTMRQGTKGGVIFDLEKLSTTLPAIDEGLGDDPTDLSSVGRKVKE